MDLAPGYTIEDSLADALLHAGDVAHSIAVDNHALRGGSNGFTFGAERYHRARQLARGPLEDHGFDLIQNGAGLMGRRGNLTLAFATARGRVSDGPVTFDTESSQVRRDASVVNSIAFQDGLDLGLKLPRVFHYVWCGTPTQGLTGVFTGCLVKLTGGGGRSGPRFESSTTPSRWVSVTTRTSWRRRTRRSPSRSSTSSHAVLLRSGLRMASRGGVGPFSGQRLRLARFRASLTARELAERVGVTPSAISQFETGRAKPTAAVAAALALACGVPVAYFDALGRRSRPTGWMAPTSEACGPQRSRRAGARSTGPRPRLICRRLLTVTSSCRARTFRPTRSPVMRARPRSSDQHRLCVSIGVCPRGPVSNVIRLLESRGGVVVTLLPLDDRTIDGYSHFQGVAPSRRTHLDKG